MAKDPAAEPKEKDKPTAAPAAPSSDASKAQPSPENLAGLRAFAGAHFGHPVEKDEKEKAGAKSEPKPDVKADDPKPKDDKATPPPAAPAKPKKAVTQPPAPPPQLTAEQIAEAAAKGVASAMKPADKPSAPAAVSVEQLPADERERVEVLEQMEKMFPDKYKGLSERYTREYVAAMKRLEDYAKRWEAENPGKKFDESDPEHSDFMDSNVVDETWQDLHFHRAAGRLEAEKIIADKDKQDKEWRESIEREKRLATAQPKIGEVAASAVRQIWKNFGDDVLTPEGQVDPAKVESMRKADPVGFKYKMGAARDLSLEAAELHKLMNALEPVVTQPPSKTLPPEQYHEQMLKYQIHSALSDFAMEMEQKFSNATAEERTNGRGQTFLPSSQYYKLTADQRQRHWTLQEPELLYLRTAKLVAQAKQMADAEEKSLRELAVAKGWKLPENVEDNKPAPIGDPANILDNKGTPPTSPSAVASSRLAASKTAGGEGQLDGLSVFAKKHLGIAS